jgi:tetratricopeptide (TPR) repeat protein
MFSFFIREAAVLLLLALPTSAQQAGSSAPSTMENPNSLAAAQSLIASGRFAEATQQLDALAAQKPKPVGIERLRGMAFYSQSQMQEAASSFAHAMADDPNDTEAIQMRGVALYRMGKPAEAIPLLEKAHGSIPTANVDGDYVLGLCYMDTRRYDDARHAFAAQYQFAPESAEAYLLAARLLLRREYLPAAIASAQKAAALAPSLPLVHELLGEVALAQADLPGSIAEFEKERKLNPLFGGVYDRLGDAYTRSGQYDRAQQALNRAVLLEPNSTGPYILLGKVLLKQRDPMLATMYLQRAVAMDPSNYIAHSLLGQAYRATGRPEDAQKETQTAERIQAANTPKLETPQ